MSPSFPGSSWLLLPPASIHGPFVLPMTVTAPRSSYLGGCFFLGEQRWLSVTKREVVNAGKEGPGSGDKKPHSLRLILALQAAIRTSGLPS